MARLIDPNSVVFLVSESKSQPMHVAGLQLFESPDGAGPEYVRELFESILSIERLAPLFLRKPTRVGGVGPWAWEQEDQVEQFDIEHHVRHSALPQPGRIRELLALTSRLHGTALTRDRPLWEITLIEGLADGRFAMYSKIHHALADGISAMRLLQGYMTSDPDRRDMPFVLAEREAKPKEPGSVVATVSTSAARSALALTAEAAGLPGALIRTLSRSIRDQAAPVALNSPRSVLNVPISGARRFAADSWPMERLRAVADASGTTLNDVVLTLCGGALRAYLLDLDALPDRSLVAMVPVSLASRNASQQGGNAIGTVMAKLGTDIADPAERLQRVSESMIAGKEALATMTPAQILAMSGIGMLPALLLPILRAEGIARPPFNLIISNVPGPKEVQYYNGARMTDTYPVSIAMNGVALNITCNSYADKMGFGLIGCRRTVPHLQHLLRHLDEALAELENAAGVG
ncbi:MAG: wax ester/triacylglycerol synthase family O-acyltransferase [Nocardioides sp.]|uniref:WS/DGAT/MGAT family O-acyltransferase n=1 Tax=Nocardioides sp. TaxID=35761 RepID=UPI0039E58F82